MFMKFNYEKYMLFNSAETDILILANELSHYV